MIFFLQKFPFYNLPWIGKSFRRGFLFDMFSCDLCLGVWVYSILAYIMSVNILDGWFGYIPVLSELITGITTSFVVHLLRIGWQAEYSEIRIGME